MEKVEAEHSSDNSHHSPTAEKAADLGKPDHIDDVALLPDPDEGLSEEEKKKIVSSKFRAQ